MCGGLLLVAFEVDRVEFEMLDDGMFVTFEIAAFDVFQQMAVGDQLAVLDKFLLDGFEEVAVFLLYEIQYRVDDILKFCSAGCPPVSVPVVLSYPASVIVCSVPALFP